MLGLGPLPAAAAASAVRAEAIWLSGMAKLAMATIAAAIMSRSLTRRAIRVIFTEVVLSWFRASLPESASGT
jgi:hypothetical protein